MHSHPTPKNDQKQGKLFLLWGLLLIVLVIIISSTFFHEQSFNNIVILIVTNSLSYKTKDQHTEQR